MFFATLQADYVRESFTSEQLEAHQTGAGIYRFDAPGEFHSVGLWFEEGQPSATVALVDAAAEVGKKYALLFPHDLNASIDGLAGASRASALIHTNGGKQTASLLHLPSRNRSATFRFCGFAQIGSHSQNNKQQTTSTNTNTNTNRRSSANL